MYSQTTGIFIKNLAAFNAGKRRACNEGGTSSSKTWSILQLLIYFAQTADRPLLISVVSESFPHLSRGCIRDFKNILGDAWQDCRWSKSNHIYTFDKGMIEFFSADEPSKLRGGRRQILFLNEANNVAYDGFKELDIRTELFTFLDWNPVSEFWAHESLIGRDENAYIHSTYLDARDLLPDAVIKNIESNKDSDPNWWNVYGLGKLGKVEGLVYPYFDQVDALPAGDPFTGLDFGFSGDPSAVVKNIITNKELYSDELVYERGLTNQDLSVKMEEAGLKKRYDEIFADSAEPKSIEELSRLGWNIKPCPKGSDSVEFGHQKMRQYKQFWTKRSLNCIKEQRNFRYITDKTGKLTEKTTHTWSHGMDARRYAVVGKAANPPAGPVDDVGKKQTNPSGIRGKAF
ncbi:terminase large subunit [Candidatus Pacearchaeota archaeon]|nr:terminase large subunit [Candidatus Pacearchaeota archaeon]